ncbi:MAG: hypothetical protein WDW36_004311 [Sanguina aurantia]
MSESDRPTIGSQKNRTLLSRSCPATALTVSSRCLRPLRHPMKYAAMLDKKLKEHGTNVWLLNTGWTGGRYGVGARISLKNTRAIVDAIHNGALQQASYTGTPIFDLQVPDSCPGVAPGVLHPETAWKDPAEFTATLTNLGQMFTENFHTFLNGDAYVGPEMVGRILQGGPKLPAA